MERKYELFSTIIETLYKQGVLEKLVLVGSWCTHYYRDMFERGYELIPVLRTTDIDFMIPSPHRIRKKVNVHEILIKMKLRPEFHTLSELVRYRHPELNVEFLTPEMGKGDNIIHEIKPFSISAVGLRYLSLLQDNIIKVEHSKGIIIQIPSPEAFTLHKFIISQRRKNDKSDKDIASAKAIGHLCLNSETYKKQLTSIFSSLPKK